MSHLAVLQITSSTILRLPITVQYACTDAGIEDLSVVMPSWMQNIRSCSEGSDVVAIWSCSQSMGIDEIAAHIAFCRLSIAEMGAVGDGTAINVNEVLVDRIPSVVATRVRSVADIPQVRVGSQLHF